MMILFAAPDTHAQLILEKEKKREWEVREFLSRIKQHWVVIFGCGKCGERLMLFCDNHNICVKLFCDNNQALQGGKMFGCPIVSPSDLKNEVVDKNFVIMLSVKKGADVVRRQLVDMGIEPDRIIDKLPIGIF